MLREWKMKLHNQRISYEEGTKSCWRVIRDIDLEIDEFGNPSALVGVALVEGITTRVRAPFRYLYWYVKKEAAGGQG